MGICDGSGGCCCWQSLHQSLLLHTALSNLRMAGQQEAGQQQKQQQC
jgi:hypothetical protein